MFKVGLTGGIGSGKSLICRIFELLNVPVFYADREARHLLETNREIAEKIAETFGRHILTAKGIDRKRLAEIVFNDSDALSVLNAIIHPEIRKDFELWISAQNEVDFVIEEAAILFESGAYKSLNHTITVSAPEKIRIERVMKRDGINRDDVLMRMRNQMDENKRNAMADSIIVNDGMQLVIPQVLEVHLKILELAGNIKTL